MTGGVFGLFAKTTISVLFILHGLLAGLAIDVRPTKDAMVAMAGDDAAKKHAAIERVKSHPENYAPPALFVLSAVLFRDGKKDEAVFWFYAGQLRAVFDAKRCADVSARGAPTVLTQDYGPSITEYAFKNKKRLKETIVKVVAWDRKMPHNYDHRWINLESMDVMIDALGEDGDKTSSNRTSLPKKQWKKIAEDTRQEYLDAFLEFLSPTGLGSPKKFFNDPKVVTLAEAAEEGNVKEIDRLAAEGANVSVRGKYGATPLFWAMWAKNKAGFQRLLEHGANPNCEIDDASLPDDETFNMKRETPSAIELAAGWPDDSQWLELLLKHHANVNHVRRGERNVTDFNAGATPLFDAIAAANMKNLDLLIRAGADVNHRNSLGNTPMIHAVQYGGGSFQIVYQLLEAGADHQIQNNSGQDIVFVTLRWSGDPKSEQGQWREKVLALLEKKGANLSAARGGVAKQQRASHRKSTEDIENRVESWPKSPRPWPKDLARPLPSQLLKEPPKSLFDEAIAVAGRIRDNDSDVKAIALRDIAAAQAAAGLSSDAAASAFRIEVNTSRKDQGLSAQLKAGRFADALATVDKIKDKKQQVRGLCEIAIAQTGAGLKKEATQTFVKATTIADAIEDKKEEIPILCDIAIAQNGVGFKKEAAKSLADMTAMFSETGKHDEWNDPTENIPWQLADAKMFPEAVAAASYIENPFVRAMRLEHIAVAQAKSGQREQARETFRKATAATLKMGESPSDKDYKIYKLCEIAEAEVKAGFEDQAGQTCIAAKGAAGGTSIFLCQVAVAQAHAGLFSAALATTHDIRYADDKSEALLGIALALSNKTSPDQARSIFLEAVASARRLRNGKDDKARDNRLCWIVEAMANVGLFDEAKAVAREIDRKMIRAKALYEIAVEQADVGLAEQARQAFVDAVAVGQHERNEDCFDLSDIAQQQAAVGFHNDALATVALIQDGSEKACALRLIVAEPPPAYMSAEARRKFYLDILAEIQKIRCKNDDEREKREAIQEVARSQAKMGFFADALASARSIKDSLDKAIALRDVVELQAKAGFLADALANTRGIEDANFKARAICAVATAWAKMEKK